MINNNYLEKTNFRILIENDNVGRMEDRLNIIGVFLDTEEHVTCFFLEFSQQAYLNSSLSISVV